MVGRWAKKSRILREYNNKIKLSRGCEECGYDKEAIHLQGDIKDTLPGSRTTCRRG